MKEVRKIDEIKVVCHRPKRKNVVWLSVFVISCVILSVLLIIIVSLSPEDFFMKILNSIGFILIMYALLFSVFFAINSLRNILAKATVILDDNNIKIYQNEILPLKKIKNLEIEKKKKKKFLKLITTDDEIKINEKIINIPVETLKYAIEIRMKT